MGALAHFSQFSAKLLQGAGVVQVLLAEQFSLLAHFVDLLSDERAPVVYVQAGVVQIRDRLRALLLNWLWSRLSHNFWRHCLWSQDRLFDELGSASFLSIYLLLGLAL